MELTGAQIIIKELLHAGADKVFGYPGGSVLDIYDELYKSRGEIRHYIFADEQGAAHAADGYARATGRVGVVIATSGPGATNLVTGIATAYLDSVPLVAITGNVATEFIGRDSFQEVNIVGVTMPVTKHNYIVNDVRDLQGTIREAFRIASDGRPGPVLIDIPKDVQKSVTEYGADAGTTVLDNTENRRESFGLNKTEKERASGLIKNSERSCLDGAIELIKSSEKPCIYAGGGVIIDGASRELAAFAELIGAPITASLMGLTAVPYDRSYFLGMAGMHGKYAASKTVAECDLLIAFGTRFSDRATGDKKRFSDGRKILQFDIDRAEINKNIKTDAYAVGGIKEILKALLSSKELRDGIVNRAAARSEWRAYAKRLKSSPENDIERSSKRLPPKFVIETVKAAFGGNIVVATDVGQHQMWTAQYFGFERPRSLVTSGGLGTMGYGMGAAIGAAIGTGLRAVLFTSDGSFHMNLNELATAASYNVPLTVILLDNNALGMVRQWQTMFYGGRYSETALDRKTDYVGLAKAFGARGFQAEDRAEFSAVLSEAVKIKTPCLIRCVIDSDESVFPMIPPDGAIGDIIIR
ncbi:MAG: biosynthetic-type acetolactate synthase large subunit [Clostridiales bacterium]|jgi:acetolactate synthase-1/2/3 large subunit|nr:biosynthetic-type acetolactate synthase large subunit [Clostridiales bacterium]